MGIWNVLGIEPCKDKEQITQAYREKLMVTNPEDFPEEFKELRNAYEEALRKCEETEEAEEDTTPLGIWMKKVDDVYCSVEKRADESCWKTLLEEEVCVALDTKEDARNRLLSYLMDSFRLPSAIWTLINEAFELEEQRSELEEKFPGDFLDYIFREMKEDSLPPFILFQGQEYAEYDTYMSLLNKSTREINSRELEEAEKTLAQLRTLSIYHPYQDINRMRIHLIQGEYEDARKIAEELYMIYPEDTEITLYMGETAYYLENFEEAEDYYNQTIEKSPQNFLARFGKADCLRKKKEYKKAKELLIELWGDYPNNAAIGQELENLNEEMIAEYEKKVSENTSDIDAVLELGWSYLQNKKTEEGIALLAHICPNEIQRFSYENLSGRLYLEHGESEKALEHLENWERLIRELPDEVPEELKREKERLQLPLYFQAYALKQMGKTEAALEKVNESLKIKADKDALNYKAYLLYEDKQYSETVEVCNELEKLDKYFIGTFSTRGRALYEMGCYQAAYEDFDRWIQNYAYDLMPYIYKMRILIYYEQYDNAKEIADYLESQNVKSDQLTVCRAQLMEAVGDAADRSSAYELYKEVVEHYDKGESDVDDIHRVYYYMAVADENDRPLDYVLEEIEKGLSYKEDYIPLYDYKAYLMKKSNRPGEAIEIYKKILTFVPDHRTANFRIAELYYDRAEFGEALGYCERQEKVETNQSILIQKGLALIELGKLKEAEEVFLEAVEMDPEEPCLYHNLGLICLYGKRHEEAIRYYERAVSAYEQREKLSENTCEQLATCQIRQGQLEKAVAAYTKLLKETGNSERYVDISGVYKYFGYYQEALNILEAHISECKDDKERAWFLAREMSLYLLMGRKKEALKCMKHCKVRRWDMEFNQADFYIGRRNYKKAREIYEYWLNNYPEHMMMLRFAAVRLMWMGDVDRARYAARKGLALLEKKKKYLDDHIEGYCKAAIFQAVLGNFQDAFYCVKKAQESVQCARCKYPICSDAEMALGIIYEMMGDKQRALDIYRRCRNFCKDDEEYIFLIERLTSC